MKSILMSLEIYITHIAKSLKLAIAKVSGPPHISGFIMAFSLYELIVEQFKKRKFYGDITG